MYIKRLEINQVQKIKEVYYNKKINNKQHAQIPLFTSKPKFKTKILNISSTVSYKFVPLLKCQAR